MPKTGIVRLGALAAILAGVASVTVSVPPAAAQPPSDRVAYLIDFDSQTLDLVDLVNGTVSTGQLPVGVVPNQIRVRDSTAYVVNAFPENLQIIDLGTLSSMSVPLPPDSSPWAVELVGDRAFVSLFGADAVAVIDLVTRQVVETIAVGIAPEGMCATADRVYVANSGFLGPDDYAPGTVSVIDVTSASIVGTVDVATNPQWCVVDATGEVNVVCSGLFAAGAGAVNVIDPELMAVSATIEVGGFPGPVALASSGLAYMVEFGAGLFVVDTTTNTAVHDIDDPLPVGGIGALGLAIDSFDRVYVAVLIDGLMTVLSPGGDIEAAFAVGAGPQDVDVFEALATPVVLSRFEATRDVDLVRLDWTTSLEASHLGFLVERRAASAVDAAFERVSDWLPANPGAYQWDDVDAPATAIDYRLVAVAADGTEERFGPLRVVASAPGVRAFVAAPNPLRSGGDSRIELALPATGLVDVRVVDVHGRRVAQIHQGVLAAGRHAFAWDGRSDADVRVPAGIYFVRSATPTGTRAVKWTVVD